MKHTLRKLLLLALCCLLLCAAVPAAAVEEDAAGYTYGCYSGIAADGEALLVTDTFNKVVWRVSGGQFTLFAGNMGVRDYTGAVVAGVQNGSLTEARFSEPWAIVPYQDGWAVSDAAANVIRLISGDTVQTLAGTGESGQKDGTASKALFSRPTGLAADDSGNLYVADTGSGAIRKLSADGMVSTICDGLCEPTGLCWKSGILYIAETGKNRIVTLYDGTLLPLAGASGNSDEDTVDEGGFADGTAVNALFRSPQGLTIAPDGTIYVADTDNGAIRRIREGLVVTIATSEETPAELVTPCGLLLDGDELISADKLSGKLCRVSLAEPVYPDVQDGDWFAAPVMQATELGLLKGTDIGFEPDGTLTRAMFAAILSRLQKSLDGDIIIDGDISFPDVQEGTWYTAASRWTADAGIVKGLEDGSFAPDLMIERQQLVTMLYRFAEYNGLDVSARADLSAFSDADAVQPYAQDAACWAIASGILTGFPDGMLAPAASATRAQAAAIIVRFLDAISF